MAEETRNQRFERVVMPHLDAAYNLARWLVRNRDDAEDVMQEAMLRAFRFLDSCRQDTARQWVVRIVRNICYDWLSARSASPVAGFADLDPDHADGAAFTCDVFGGPPETPEEIVARRSTVALVGDMIDRLPAAFREVVVLRELEEFSYKEIAEVVGIPVGTVMSRLSRARAQLAAEWERQNGRDGL